MGFFFYQLGLSPHHPHEDGLSTRFITTPLTIGHIPSQHFDLVLSKLFWFTPTVPTCPTIAKQFLDIKQTSLESNFNVANTKPNLR